MATAKTDETPTQNPGRWRCAASILKCAVLVLNPSLDHELDTIGDVAETFLITELRRRFGLETFAKKRST